MTTASFPQTVRKRTRKGTPLTRGGSADSHRTPRTLDILRRECQSLLRTNKLARSMVKRIQDHVVGDRVRCQARSSNKAFNAAVEKWFNTWADSCEFSRGRSVTSLCRNVIKSALRDGDEFWIKAESGHVQVIEAERCQNPWGPGAINTKLLRSGVQLDAAGRVVAFNFAEWTGSDGGSQTEFTPRRVDAGAVVHMANPADDETNLTRPEPGLAALIDDFPEVGKYITDVRIAAEMATLFGLVTKTQNPEDFGGMMPGESVTRGDGLTTTAGGSEEREVSLEPAFMMHLQPGEDITQIKPEQPTTVFSDFVFSNLTIMGAEVGLPVVLWMLDLSKVNFHSARSAIILAYLGFCVWRAWLKNGGGGGGLNAIYRWRVAMALERGEIEGFSLGDGLPDDWDACDWQFRPAPMLDPYVQAQADAFAIEKGLETHRDVAAARGHDLDELLEQLAYERKEKERLGILPVLEPGAADPNAAGMTAPAGADDGETDSTDDGADGGADDGADGGTDSGGASTGGDRGSGGVAKRRTVADANVQQTALNGAQVASLLTIGERVADGSFTREAAKAAVEISYPATPGELVDQYIDNIEPGSMTPEPAAPPAPAPAPTGDAP